MKRITSSIVYMVFMLGIFLQCENLPTDPPPTEDELTQAKLVVPTDESMVESLETELVWAQIRGAKTYQVLLSESATFETSVMDTTINGTSITTPQLTPETNYSWKVLPIKKNQTGPWSEVWTFTTKSEDSVGTTDMAKLISPADGSEEISIDPEFTWNSLSGAGEYTYQLSDNSSFSSVITEDILSDTTYTQKGLAHQTTYFWRVKDAADSTGETWSNAWDFTTVAADSVSNPDPEPDPEPTSPVTLISPADNADKVSTNLEFKWNPVTGINEYTYQLTDSGDYSSVILEKTISDTSYSPAELSERKKYFWRVKVATDNTGETWSESRSFTTGATETNPDPEPSTIVNLLSPADNASEVSINPGFEWEEVFGVSSYEFQLSENSTFSTLIEESVEFGTSYQSNTLNYQKTYYWRVKVSGQSYEWSNVRSFTTQAEPISTPPPTSSSFVQIHNSNFVQDGKVMRYAGTNAYYLPNYEKLNPAVVDRALNTFSDTGIDVIRMWGFYDGYDCGYSKTDPNENVIQTAPGEYSEEALRDLDKVIAKGKERGIGFIIPFVNYWDELGGICQYNTWAGAANPSTNMEFFMSNDKTQKWYKDYINMLLNRVNTVTGIAYKDEPAIVAWQIMNEGRNPGADATVLRDWYQDIAQYIKSIDSNHMVSTGEEGFDEGTPSEYSAGEYSNTYTLRAQVGSSYVLNTAIPEIDFGNAHWYPSEYGFGMEINEDLLRAQRAWISDHKKIAESYGKPFIIGEFGFPGWGDKRVSNMYNALYKHAETEQLDGNFFWQLTADGTKCWEFGGNICYPAGREDTQLYNDFKNHVTNLGNLK